MPRSGIMVIFAYFSSTMTDLHSVDTPTQVCLHASLFVRTVDHIVTTALVLSDCLEFYTRPSATMYYLWLFYKNYIVYNFNGRLNQVSLLCMCHSFGDS